MHPRPVLGLINLLIAAGLVLGMGEWWQSPAKSQAPPPVVKVSSLLGAQVQEKSQRFAQARQNRPRGMEAVEVPRQKLFVHFERFPSPTQTSELQEMGLLLFPDSWIPPAGAGPTGFMYAEMPVTGITELARKEYITFLQSAEAKSRPRNDQAAVAMDVNPVWSSGIYGSGVRVAVLDSGLDLTHPDVPTPLAKADYSLYPTISYGSVANTVTGHGTHVTGAALGRGTQSLGGPATYKGTAPEAGLVFLKIGRDDASATTAAMVGAIRDAVDVFNARVISMSYGLWSTYHDGTSELSQAVDYAAGKGAVFFGAAGNEALVGQHYSGTVAASSKSDFIRVNVSAGTNNTVLAFNLVWFDGPGTRNDLSLEFYSTNSDASRVSSTNNRGAESTRGTESELSRTNNYLAPGTASWYVKVNNSSPYPQSFHIYYDDQYNLASASAYPVIFEVADRDYTINDPAEADSAIAVGAYVTRTSWTDYKGNPRSTDQTPAAIAGYSSRGPRVDNGSPGKPNLVAPGSMIISLRDKDVPIWPGYSESNVISNTGVANGPADYFIIQGTSVATPSAAGVGALMLSRNLALTPAQVRQYLQDNAVRKGGTAGWNNIYGWGLINAQAAVNAVPVASFTKNVAPTSGIVPVTVDFTDTSVGNIQSWWWSFGDGMTSTAQNPSKVYNSAGNFPVVLLVSNATSGHSVSQMVSTYSMPSANFTRTMLPVNGVVPVTVNFADSSTGNPTAWSWQFGDGATSTAQNPSRVYTAAGNYNVNLAVTNPAGGNSLSQTVSVYAPPAASFTATTFSGVTPLALNFTDTSIGNVTGWQWNFGDGTSSSEQNPSKTYNLAGNYNVTLTATNPAGSNSAAGVIKVYSIPAASFSAYPTVTSPGSAVNFYDQSTGNVTNWSWNFGDGTFSNTQNPAKSYASGGQYSVTLTVSNPAGNHSLSKTGYISIQDYRAEIVISQGIDAGGYVYVAGKINRFLDPYSSATVTITDGIGSYDAHMTHSTSVNFRAGSGVAPFNSPSLGLNTLGGTRSTAAASQTGSTPQPPVELFRFYPWIIGHKDFGYDIGLRFNAINRTGGGNVPQNADAIKTFKRGDANNDSVVNVVDALFIAQYLAQLRTIGEGAGQLSAVNSATPMNDSASAGSTISIVDALAIAQMLAGLRDAFYNFI